MAIYRSIHITFWQDEFVLTLTPEEKYFYLYLMTNSKTKQCGIYELPIKIAIMETGYNEETINKLFNKFEKNKKIIRSKSTSEICIINWLKYNFSKSPKVLKCIHLELDNVKDKSLLRHIDTVSIGYKYSMDTGPNRYREEEKEKQEEKEEQKQKQEKKYTMLEIEKLFIEIEPACYNYSFERKSIYILINKINELFNKDPPLKDIGIIDFVKNMITVYAVGKKAKKTIFQNPIVPHILASNNMFPQIIEEMKKNKIEQDEVAEINDSILNAVRKGVNRR